MLAARVLGKQKYAKSGEIIERLPKLGLTLGKWLPCDIVELYSPQSDVFGCNSSHATDPSAEIAQARQPAYAAS